MTTPTAPDNLTTLTTQDGRLPTDIVNMINQLTIKQSIEIETEKSIAWSDFGAYSDGNISVIKYTYGETHHEFRIKHKEVAHHQNMARVIIDLLNNNLIRYPIKNVATFLSQIPSYRGHFR